MSAFDAAALRARALAERIDRLNVRERVLVFGAAVTLVYVAWQTFLMDPLAARAAAAEQRLQEIGQRLQAVDATVAAGDPRAQALARRRALSDRLATLDATLRDAASGYVPPERMTAVLRDVLESQRGLRLVSLRNLPVESLARPARDATDAAPTPPGAAGVPDAAAPATDSASAPAPAAAESQGPFVHPVELVVDGDYAAVVAYLQALERLPWRLQWRRLDLAAGEYPTNRVRIEIGTLSLSREWLSV
jgi:MSHA biogenesis protein MshJ